MEPNQGTRGRTFAAAAVLLALAAALTAWQAIALIRLMTPAGIPVAVDWQTYANAVSRLLAGGSIYAPIQLSGAAYQLPESSLIGYSYPPASVVLMAPFANVPLGVAAWFAIQLGAFLLGVGSALRRELGSSWLLGMGLGLAALATLKPLSSAIVSGNVSLAIAGAYAWSWTWDRRWSGRLPILVTALLAVTKIVPGALGATIWREHGPRAALWTALLAAGIIVVTLPVVGLGPWRDYPVVLGSAQPLCGTPVPSVACIGLAWGLPEGAARAAGVVLGGGLAILAIVVPWRALSFGLVGLAMTAPTTDLHDHVLLVPAVGIIVLFSAWIGDARRRAGGLSPAAAGPIPPPGAR